MNMITPMIIERVIRITIMMMMMIMTMRIMSNDKDDDNKRQWSAHIVGATPLVDSGPSNLLIR